MLRSICFAGILFACIGASVANSTEPASNCAQREELLQKLLAERVKSADDALNATIVSHNEDGLPYLQYLLVEQKRFNAVLEFAKTPTEKLAEHERHLRSLREIEKKCHALYHAGSKGGEADRYFTVKTARETAEIDLLRARLKAGDPSADANTLPKLLAARLKTASTALDATITGYREEMMPIMQYILVVQKIIYARLELAEKLADKLVIYEAQARALQEEERKTEALRLAGSKGGEDDRYFTVKLAREAADVELLKARLRRTYLATDAKKLQDLLSARVKTAQQAYKATVDSPHDDGLPLVQYLYVEQRFFNAEFEAANSAAAKIAACELRVSRARTTERAIEKLFESGVHGGDAELYYSVKAVRETAEIELLKAQLARK